MNLDPPATLQEHCFEKTDTTAWSELEQAFFASAPPDEPEPPAEPFVPAAAARGPHRRTVAIVLAAIALLIGLGLSAAVLAAHERSPLQSGAR